MNVSEEYEGLYHYTNLEGLKGIIENRCLWATHHRYLNDSSESLLMKDKLTKRLSPIIHQEYKSFLESTPHKQKIMPRIEAEGGFAACVQLITTELLSIMYKALPGTGFYITSFCGVNKDDIYASDNGVLSQWRGYGKDGGYAIVFDTEGLKTFLERENGCFSYLPGSIMSPVVYSNDDKRLNRQFSKELSCIDCYVQAFVKCWFNRALSSEVEEMQNEALKCFVYCVILYKHEGFKEENEVRIHAYPNVHDKRYLSPDSDKCGPIRPEKELKFRNKNGDCIPYIELFASLKEDLPIKRIIVGPHRNQESRVSALKVMLRNRDIEITRSKIPYVGI